MPGYRVLSFWHDTVPDPLSPRDPLPGDTDVDVAIVGAGPAGIYAADILANSIGVGLGLALVRTPLGRLLSAVDARIGAIRFR